MNEQMIISGLLFKMAFEHIKKGNYSIKVSKFNNRPVGDIEVDITNFNILYNRTKELNKIVEHIRDNKLLYLGKFKETLCPSQE